jgi:hypothetical protein
MKIIRDKKTIFGDCPFRVLFDKVANNAQELNNVIIAKGFGGLTEVEVGADGNLYVLS